MTQSQRLRFWLIGLVVFLALVWLLKGMLLPFVAGMVIAYFLDPLADRLEAVGLSRTVSTAIVTGGFFLVFFGILVVLVPLIEHQVVEFIHRVPGYIETLEARIEPLIVEIKRKLSKGDIERLRSSAGEYAGTAITWGIGVIKGMLSGGLAILSLLSLLFITPIVAFYLLHDWDDITAKIDSWLPRDHADTIREQVREIDRTISGFVRGQATVCLVMAAFYGLGLSLVGLDLGLVIGIGAGLFSFVPYLGVISGFIAGIALGFAQTQGWELPGLVAVVFAAGQVLEGNFLTPKLVGSKVGLHPVWIMFALLAFGSLFGFVGVLLAVPVAAVIGVLVRFAVGRYLASRLFHGDGRP
jgi:predicted PurR-regulated permease PerM